MIEGYLNSNMKYYRHLLRGSTKFFVKLGDEVLARLYYQPGKCRHLTIVKVACGFEGLMNSCNNLSRQLLNLFAVVVVAEVDLTLITASLHWKTIDQHSCDGCLQSIRGRCIL